MAFWSLLAKPLAGMFTKQMIGSALLGAGGSYLAQRQLAKENRLDLGRLRAQSAQHGFNPLTVLGATGGRGFEGGGGSAAGFLSHLAMQGQKMFDYSMGADQRQADLNLTNAQAKYYNTSADTTVQTGPRETDYMDFYLENPDAMIPARNFAGQPIRVRADVMARLDLPPGSLYGIGEDYEGIFGEFGGQIGGIDNLLRDGTGVIGGTPIVDNARTVRQENPPMANPSQNMFDFGTWLNPRRRHAPLSVQGGEWDYGSDPW